MTITGRTASQILDSQRVLLEKEIQRSIAAFEEETGCLVQAIAVERFDANSVTDLAPVSRLEGIVVSFTIPRATR